MKKILLSVIFAVAATLTTQAQDIYLEIKQSAQDNVNNPATNELVKAFSSFKIDALDYMAIKMKEVIPDSSATFLDKEALSLNIFLTKYTTALLANSEQPANYQLKIIKAFMDASYSNPLFNDPDQELTLSYFNNGNSLTRFSLDTDWRRAVLAADEALNRLEQDY